MNPFTFHKLITKISLLTVLISVSFTASTQPPLLPSIGIASLPSDNDSICYIPWYTGGFGASGLQAGDTAYDFTLYDLNGDSLNLGEALSHGKPVLLVAGSYTCPVYRNKIPALNSIVSLYAGLVDVYIIYTVEAHPIVDTSVYFGYVNPTTTNLNEGVTYRQPVTYGERKNVVQDMLSAMTITSPVFLDGPCNNWWMTYGPAPNNAYLIDTNGVVFAKHAWFDKYPEDMDCDIDSLLGTSLGTCAPSGGNSTFAFQMVSHDTVMEEAGIMISVDAQLTNTGTSDIIVYARRLLNDLPPNWASSMCIDVCYSTTTDTVVFVLPAGATQDVHVYFYSSPSSSDTGYVRLGFRNQQQTSNQVTFEAVGVSTLTTSIEDNPGRSCPTVFPNPASSVIQISDPQAEFDLYNSFGLPIKNGRDQIDLTLLSPGVYYLEEKSNKGCITRILKL